MPSRVFPHLVGLGDGTFDLVFATGSGSEFTLQRLGSDGAPMGAAISLGADVPSTTRFDLAFDGTDVLVASGSATGSTRIFAVSAMTGARRWGPFDLPIEPNRLGLQPRLAAVAPGRATVYVPQLIMNGSGGITIRRYRVDTSGAVPTIIFEYDTATDGLPPPFDVVSTLSGDVILYGAQNGDLRLGLAERNDSGGGAAFTAIGTIQTHVEQPGAISVALAIRSQTEVVDSINPIGVAWERDHGSYFARIESVTSASLSGLTMLPGSHGPPVLPEPLYGIRLVATPVSNGSPPLGTRFYVAGIEGDPATSMPSVATLSVWEAFGARPPRALPVPSESMAIRHVTGFASSAGVVRVVEENRTGDIVTRSLGCH
jgi:hypothetical protein